MSVEGIGRLVHVAEGLQIAIGEQLLSVSGRLTERQRKAIIEGFRPGAPEPEPYRYGEVQGERARALEAIERKAKARRAK